MKPAKRERIDNRKAKIKAALKSGETFKAEVFHESDRFTDKDITQAAFSELEKECSAKYIHAKSAWASF